MTAEIPKLDLLIKLMGKTTSDNDSEALLFLRKANEQVRAAGWTWETLLRGKVTIIADPFRSTPLPERATNNGWSTVPSRPAPPRRPAPPQNPLDAVFAAAAGNAAQAYNSRPTSRTNQYSGNCWNCGKFVGANAGTIRRDTLTKNKWEVFCPSHATTAIAPKRARRLQAASAADLAF